MEKSKFLGTIILSHIFTFIVFVVFLILKLTNVVNWNWFWICSPVIINMGVVVLGTLLMILIYWINEID